MRSDGIALRIGWFFRIDHDWRFLPGSEWRFPPDANNGFLSSQKEDKISNTVTTIFDNDKYYMRNFS